MCVIPYGTQDGEISFCAYNTGVGWRQIVEEMNKTASLSEWYKENGRHAVYAKGKEVPGIAKTRSLSFADHCQSFAGRFGQTDGYAVFGRGRRKRNGRRVDL